MNEELASIMDSLNAGTRTVAFDVGRCQRFTLKQGDLQETLGNSFLSAFIFPLLNLFIDVVHRPNCCVYVLCLCECVYMCV